MNTTNDDGLERFPEAGSAANIGIMLFRKAAIRLAKVWQRAELDLHALTVRCVILNLTFAKGVLIPMFGAQEWNEVLLADDKVWDQNAFNDLFRRTLMLDGPETQQRIFRYGASPCA